MTRFIASIAFTGLLVLLTFIVRSIAEEPRLKAKDDDATQLKTMQNERVDVLTQLVKVSMADYAEGKSAINEVASAQSELAAAQLDSTDEPEKRIAIFTQQVERADELLKLAKTKFEAGVTRIADVYQARSLLLDAKIKLLRERKSATSGTPSSARLDKLNRNIKASIVK